MNSRRKFLHNLVVSAGPLVLLGGRALAQTSPPPVKLDETDPVAMALGFRLDTRQVDPRKYPLHTPEQKCSGCILYQGKPGEALAPCLSIGGKLVPMAGWCAVYSKKPEVKC